MGAHQSGKRHLGDRRAGVWVYGNYSIYYVLVIIVYSIMLIWYIQYFNVMVIRYIMVYGIVGTVFIMLEY